MAGLATGGPLPLCDAELATAGTSCGLAPLPELLLPPTLGTAWLDERDSVACVFVAVVEGWYGREEPAVVAAVEGAPSGG